MIKILQILYITIFCVAAIPLISANSTWSGDIKTVSDNQLDVTTTQIDSCRSVITSAGRYLISQTSKRHGFCSTKIFAPPGTSIRVIFEQISESLCQQPSFLLNVFGSLSNGYEFVTPLKTVIGYLQFLVLNGWLFSNHFLRKQMYQDGMPDITDICSDFNGHSTEVTIDKNYAELIGKTHSGDTVRFAISVDFLATNEKCDVMLNADAAFMGSPLTIRANNGKTCRWILPGSLLVEIENSNLNSKDEKCQNSATFEMLNAGVSGQNVINRTICRTHNTDARNQFVFPCGSTLFVLRAQSGESTFVTFRVKPIPYVQSLVQRSVC